MNKDSLPSDSNDGVDEELMAWFQQFVMPKPWRDDRDAPRVDRDYLRKVVRNELSKESARGAHILIYEFGCLRKAYREIIVEEFHKRFPSSTSLQQ